MDCNSPSNLCYIPYISVHTPEVVGFLLRMNAVLCQVSDEIFSKNCIDNDIILRLKPTQCGEGPTWDEVLQVERRALNMDITSCQGWRRDRMGQKRRHVLSCHHHKLLHPLGASPATSSLVASILSLLLPFDALPQNSLVQRILRDITTRSTCVWWLWSEASPASDITQYQHNKAQAEQCWNCSNSNNDGRRCAVFILVRAAGVALRCRW